MADRRPPPSRGRRIETISVTTLRRRLTTVINRLQTADSPTIVVTVGGCPRLVVVNFQQWAELSARTDNNIQ